MQTKLFLFVAVIYLNDRPKTENIRCGHNCPVFDPFNESIVVVSETSWRLPAINGYGGMNALALSRLAERTWLTRNEPALRLSEATSRLRATLPALAYV